MTIIRKVLLTANDLGGLGGVSTFIVAMAREFARLNYEVSLVGFDCVGTAAGFDEFETLTVFDEDSTDMPSSRDYLLGVRDPRFRLRRREVQQKRRHQLAKLQPVLSDLDSETAVVCAQVFAMENFLEAGFKPRDRRGPIVFGQHHESFRHARSGTYLRRMLKSYSDIDRMVALTQTDADLFTLAGIPATTAIPNPVATPESDPNYESRTVVSLARYAPEKRQERILYAWSELHSDFPGWDLQLWGEGQERESLEALIHELGIGGTARLMGRTNEVAAVFSSSAVNVLTSDSEGLPISIVEASRRSVPTIAMDCAPGISELIDDGVTGVVVPAKSTAAFVSSLRDLMADSDKRLRMGLAARTRSARYSPDVIIGRWEEEFERALR